MIVVGVPFHCKGIARNIDRVQIPYPEGTTFMYLASDSRITIDNPTAPDPFETAAVPPTGVTISLRISYTVNGLPFTHSATSAPFNVESNRTTDPIASLEVVVE